MPDAIRFDLVVLRDDNVVVDNKTGESVILPIRGIEVLLRRDVVRCSLCEQG